MLHANEIEATIELKNFIFDLKTRPDPGFARCTREQLDDFLVLCKKAGMGKNLTFYCYSDSQRSTKKVELDEKHYVCRIISSGTNNSIVASEAWEASMFLLLLVSICKHRRILYLPWSDITSFLYPENDEHAWTPLMKFLRSIGA